MSDTPRTDAIIKRMADEGLDMADRENQLQDHTSTLERQNAELLAALKGVLVWMPIYPQSAECLIGGKDAYEAAHAKAREAIRRAEA
jgi:hypothetical protein